MKAILYIAVIILSVLLLSCTEQPTRDNPYDPGFDLPEPEITGLDDISLTHKQLSWDYELDNMEGFMINRRDDTEWQEEILIAPEARTWLDTMAAVNKHIQYKIKAVAGENESDYMSSVILDNMMTAVDSFAVSQVSVSRFLLSWQQEHIIGEEGFIIKRKIDDELWEEIAILELDTSEYEDDLAVRSYQRVSYQIYNFVGDELSPPAIGSCDILFPGPAAVEYEKLAINRIKLTWQEEINGEEGFYIDLIIDGVTLERYAVLAENTTEWIDEWAPINHDLQYKVYAFAGDNTSNYTITTIIDNTFPAVIDLTVEQQNVHQFLLSWEQEHIIGEEGYRLERAFDEGEYNQLTLLQPDTEQYIDDICQRDSVGTVHYRIRGFLGDDQADFMEAECTINITPPGDVSYNMEALDQIRLNWTDNSEGEEGFIIDRKVGDNLWFHRYDTTDENAETWIDTAAIVYENITYRVSAFAGIYESDYVQTEIIDTTLPEIENLNIEPVDIHTFQLSWEQDNIMGEQSFVLSRRVNDNEFVQIAELPADTEEYLDDICTRDMLNELAYQVCIDFGEYYSHGVIDSIEVGIPAPDYTGYSRIAVDCVSIHWIDNAEGEDGYIIDRSANISGYTAEIGITGENVEEWLDEDVPVNEIITYRLRTFAGIYQSTYEPGTAIHNDLPAPANFDYEILSLNQIELSWGCNCFGISGYKIDKKVGNGAWIEEYGITDGETFSWIDENVEVNEIISYRVYIYYEDEVSDYVLIEDIDTSIPSPTELGYEKLNIYTIQLNWQDNSSGEDGFKIDKKVVAGNWVNEYAIVGDNIQSWSDEDAEINENLQYRVYAYYEEFESGTIETGVIDNTFPAPSGLELNQINVSQFQLTWQDNCIGELGYRIERKIDEGNWLDLGLIVEDTYFDDLSQRREQTYNQIYYRIRAEYNDEYSNWNFANTAIEFPAPANLAVERINYNELELIWEDNSINEDGFIIERIEGEDYIEIGSVNSNQTSFIDDTVELNNQYSYRVRAFVEFNNGIQYSDYSNNEIVKNDFIAPDGLQIINQSTTYFEFSWNDNSLFEEGFKVERKFGTANWEEIAILPPNTSTWTDDSYEVSIHAEYYYRICSFYENYFTEYDELYKYKPHLINTITMSNVLSITADQDLFITSSNVNGLNLYNLSDPSNLNFASNLDEYLRNRYEKVDNYIVTDYDGNDLHIVDISDIYTPQLIDEISWTSDYTDNVYCTSSGYIFLLSYRLINGSCINIFNLEDIENISNFGAQIDNNYNNTYRCPIISEDYILILKQLNSSAELITFEMPGSNGTITEINNITISYDNYIYNLYLHEDYLFTREHFFGEDDMVYHAISIYNVANPENPFFITQYVFPWNHYEMTLNDLDVSGNYIFATCGEQNVRVIDISDIYNPVMVASVNDYGNGGDIEIEGNYAYVSSSSGIAIIRIFDE